jgi:hypothetical protein
MSTAEPSALALASTWSHWGLALAPPDVLGAAVPDAFVWAARGAEPLLPVGVLAGPQAMVARVRATPTHATSQR